jgi:hypothetical protein
LDLHGSEYLLAQGKKEKKKSHISVASAKHTYMPRKNEFDLLPHLHFGFS